MRMVSLARYAAELRMLSAIQFLAHGESIFHLRVEMAISKSAPAEFAVQIPDGRNDVVGRLLRLQAR